MEQLATSKISAHFWSGIFACKISFPSGVYKVSGGVGCVSDDTKVLEAKTLPADTTDRY